MPRGYRGILGTLVGGLILAASPTPSDKAEAEQGESAQAGTHQLARIATVIDKHPQATTPDPGCPDGKEKRDSDLCAQWKAADAAAESARWALWALALGVSGLGVGMGTLYFAARAAIYAKKAAKETRRGAKAAIDAVAATQEANTIARQTALNERRPWLVITSFTVHRLEIDLHCTTACVSYTVKNVGGSPAFRVRPRYYGVDSVDWKFITGAAETFVREHAADKAYRLGFIVAPNAEWTIENINFSVLHDVDKGADRRINPLLFINLLYDAAGFDEPRETLEAYRVGPGDEKTHGFTGEFFSPSFDIPARQQPTRWLRYSRTGDFVRMS